LVASGESRVGSEGKYQTSFAPGDATGAVM
jgi:hypothetical protein